MTSIYSDWRYSFRGLMALYSICQEGIAIITNFSPRGVNRKTKIINSYHISLQIYLPFLRCAMKTWQHLTTHPLWKDSALAYSDSFPVEVSDRYYKMGLGMGTVPQVNKVPGKSSWRKQSFIMIGAMSQSKWYPSKTKCYWQKAISGIIEEVSLVTSATLIWTQPCCKWSLKG